MAQEFTKLHWSRFVQFDEYLTPSSLDEALAMLADHKGQARVIAGGTDVVPQLRGRKYQVGALVDITRLPGLDGISQDGGIIKLGPLVTHAKAAASELIQTGAKPLAEGCVQVGSPQIRNLATVGGNLISGQPAADASVPLLALGASVTIASPDGERTVALPDFFQGVGKTALDPSREIMTGISFTALGKNSGGCYLRLATRKALTLPMLVCAAVVSVEAGAFKDVALALGPVAPTPWREAKVEQLLVGQPISQEIIAQAADAASTQCSPRDSLLRGSCDYRQEMVRVYVQRGLNEALSRAGHALPSGGPK